MRLVTPREVIIEVRKRSSSYPVRRIRRGTLTVYLIEYIQTTEISASWLFLVMLHRSCRRSIKKYVASQTVWTIWRNSEVLGMQRSVIREAAIRLIAMVHKQQALSTFTRRRVCRR